MAVATALRTLFAPEVTRLKAWLNEKLHKKGRLSCALGLVEDKTGLPRLYAFYMVWAVVIAWLVVGPANGLLCNVLAFSYPAYKSMQVVSTSMEENKSCAASTVWLCYWLIFSTFSVLEFFSSFIVSWLPFYWLSKFIFMTWCMSPMEANGSVVVSRFVLEVYQDTRDLIKSRTHQEVQEEKLE